MDYDTIFEQFYTLYRAEATTPAITDDEYIIGIRLANNAIRRWSNYDNTFWKTLFTTAQTDGTGGVVTTTAGTATYAAPTAMKEAGGVVRLLDGTDTQKVLPIIEVEEVQFKSDDATYAYFTGNANSGFTLHLNPAPDTSGLNIDYVYYKNPTLITTGTDKPDMQDADFIVNHMLADRFRASRNPYYGTAKTDAKDILIQMKFQNDSGTWANPWSLKDRSGSVWGEDVANGWSW